MENQELEISQLKIKEKELNAILSITKCEVGTQAP